MNVEPFVPAWWCRSPHAQTLWPSLMRRAPCVRLRRERLELPDGDFIDLDWVDNTHRTAFTRRSEDRQSPLVVVLHGLEGSSRSNYARGLLRRIRDRGWRGVVMHFRGCSGEPNRLARSYHSGDTGDLDYLIRVLREREPPTPLAAVGYSLGGNVLLKWLGETGMEAPLHAAVAVSVPYVLDQAAARLGRGFSRMYQWKLLASLRRSVLRKHGRIALPIAVANVRRLRTFYDFDDHVTAPLHGFTGAAHYYAASSSRPFLRHIAVPALLLHARDDPFMTEAVIPSPEELSPTVCLELYPHGGHVGFVTGAWPWRARYWLDDRIPEFLETCWDREHSRSYRAAGAAATAAIGRGPC